MKEAFQDAKKAPVTALGGSVEVVTRAELAGCRHWAHAFSSQRKDHRYYELVEDTIRQDFDYRYFVLKDGQGQICAVQPFFLLDQDLLAGIGGPVTASADFVRRWWPGFLRMRTLMVGCTAGEGHLDRIDELSRGFDAQLLAGAIERHARELKARLIVLKEFPAKYRGVLECFREHGFTRVPSLPMVILDLGFSSFDDYMTKTLSKWTRTKIKRKFKDLIGVSPIEMSVVNDITEIVDDVYPLYLQVYGRSTLQFEKLTREYFCDLGRLMPDKVRFFVWRQDGKAIALSICLVQGDAIYSEYLGLDYAVAYRLHLYYYAFRDVMTWAINNGYKRYFSTGLSYDPKWHLRFRLYPLDLYVRHTSRILNVVLARLLPLIEPTRYDKTLPRFANYHELWDNGPAPQSVDVIPSRLEEKEVA
jgi:hypothetical protein